MEESLRALIERPEWEGDVVLAIQLRCILVTHQITDLSLQQALLGQEIRLPMYFQQSLVAQLADIWRTVPPSVAQSGMYSNSQCPCRLLVSTQLLTLLIIPQRRFCSIYMPQM